jgi:hypothetical protein
MFLSWLPPIMNNLFLYYSMTIRSLSIWKKWISLYLFSCNHHLKTKPFLEINYTCWMMPDEHLFMYLFRVFFLQKIDGLFEEIYQTNVHFVNNCNYKRELFSFVQRFGINRMSLSLVTVTWFYIFCTKKNNKFLSVIVSRAF